MAAPALEERASGLEGGYEHLATKADVERVRVDLERLRAEMERINANIERGIFRLGVAVISAIGVITGIILAVVKLT